MITTSTTSKPQTTLPPLGMTFTHSPAVTGDRIYYRSKISNTVLGINPLIAAAAPLFALTASLANLTHVTNIEKLSLDLQHEIKAFENNAKAQHYRSESILIARYLLCAFLDEQILYSPWSKLNAGLWPSHLLLLYFHQETDSTERFFIILDRLMADAEIYADLLELSYLCLNLGYQGKYRFMTNGKETLHEISQDVFDCIRLNRPDLKKEFHITVQSDTAPVLTQTSLPVFALTSFAGTLLLTVYSIFNFMLITPLQHLYVLAT